MGNAHGDIAQSCFPTVVAWPAEWTQQQCVELLAGTGVIDAPSARLTLGRDVPLILGLFDEGAAHMLIQAVRSAGGDGFVPSLRDIAALGPTLKIKDIRLVEGNLEVDIWRGLTTMIRREHVQFLVHGRVRPNAKRDSAARVAERVRDNVQMMTNLSPQYGTAARMAADRHLNRLRAEAGDAGLQISEKLDIHTTSGMVFQIDGDKFAFQILGDMKGHSDAVNMRQLTEMLAHISPNEIVDEYFPLFRLPPGYDRLLALVPEIRRNREDPGFAFYSRWSALLYRYMTTPA